MCNLGEEENGKEVASCVAGQQWWDNCKWRAFLQNFRISGGWHWADVQAVLVTLHLCLQGASITVIIMGHGASNWRRKINPILGTIFLDEFSPLNRNNLPGNPAGVHMLLITVGYLALQNDMLLNGLLMVIGFSLFFFNELHQFVTNAL